MSDFYTHFSLHRNKLFLKGVTDGNRFQRRVDIEPSLYLRSDTDVFDQKTIHGEALKEMSFDKPSDLRTFVKDARGSMSLYGFPHLEYVEIDKLYPQQNIEFDYNKLNVSFIDIECECENGFPEPRLAENIINAITMTVKEKYYVFSLFDYEVQDDDVIHTKFSSEEKLLTAFVRFWKAADIDIITGWNTEFFDIPYIYYRLINLFGEEFARQLSPINSIRERKVNSLFGEREIVNIMGIESLDFQRLYTKFTYTVRPSYKLDYIAHVELGEKKLDYTEEGGKLHLLYLNNPQKFVHYNVQDVRLVKKLEEKLKLISLATTLAFRMKVNFGDVFSQTRMWDVKIANYMRSLNMQVPYETKNKKTEKFPGAFVRDPNKGYYKYVCSFDLESLYPNIIMQNNISPEKMFPEHEFINIDSDTVVDDDAEMARHCKEAIKGNYSIAGNGALFSNDSAGIFPILTKSVFEDRKIAKKQMTEWKQKLQKDPDNQHIKNKISDFNNQQMAAKIQINSLYGALGAPSFRWFELHQAKAVTFTGQAVIKWAAKKMNAYMNGLMKTDDVDYIIYGDTDSIYLDTTQLVEKVYSGKEVHTPKAIEFLDRWCDKYAADVISEAYQELAERTNAFENKMWMKREVIGSGVFIQKKKYAMRIYDDEGVRLAEPKMKVMGLESVRSTYPDWCRNKMTQVFELIFTAKESTVIDFIESTKEEFMTLPIVDIAEAKGVSTFNKYIGPDWSVVGGAQTHIRAAIYHNRLLTEMGLDKNYELIKEGDKVKILTLNARLNPYGLDAIACSNFLPPEFELDKYIDKDAMWDKLFMDPINRVFEVVGWRTEKKVSFFNLGKK